MTNTLTHGERRLGRPTWRNSATVGALPGASPAPHRSSWKTLRASAPPSRYPGALPFGCAHHRARSRTRPPGELRRITHPTPAPGAGRLAISAPSLPFPPSPNLPAVRDRSSGMPQRKASERDLSYLATCHTSGVIGRNASRPTHSGGLSSCSDPGWSRSRMAWRSAKHCGQPATCASTFVKAMPTDRPSRKYASSSELG